MKLTCDLCCGQLQMNADGQRGCCSVCGLEYSRERLLEMLHANAVQAPAEAPAQMPSSPQMRNFYLKRKFSLSGAAAKAAIYLDGELCAVLSSHGEACVPISEGVHTVSVRLGTQVLENLSFSVGNRDVLGVLYLKRGAFAAQFVFEVSHL